LEIKQRSSTRYDIPHSDLYFGSENFMAKKGLQFLSQIQFLSQVKIQIFVKNSPNGFSDFCQKCETFFCGFSIDQKYSFFSKIRVPDFCQKYDSSLIQILVKNTHFFSGFSEFSF